MKQTVIDLHTNKIVKVEQATDAPFYLTWIINNICTNQCSYCPTDLHTGVNHNYDWNNARKFFDTLFEKYGKVFCSIAGGEPSVSPFLPEVVKTFHTKGSGVSITTNGAKTADYWNDIAPYISSLVFSWHPEFVEKVLAASKHTRVTVRIMMYNHHWKKSVDAFNFYKTIPEIDMVTPVRVYDWVGKVDIDSHNYTAEQLEWFKENQSVGHFNKRPNIVTPGTDLKFYFSDGTSIVNPSIINFINQGYTNFRNHICEAGVKHLYVNWEGNVYRANCRIGGVIGNINDPDNIQWPTSPILCTQDLCSCSTDVIINKSTFKLSKNK